MNGTSSSFGRLFWMNGIFGTTKTKTGFTKPPNFCIVTEYMSLGSLRSLIDSPAGMKMRPKHLVKVALSVARGMEYLHDQEPAIIHRDLNARNVLVDENWTIKVADYGLSEMIEKQGNSFAGMANWRAPEVFEDSRNFSKASDVYSYGMMIWELISSKVSISFTQKKKKSDQETD